jgi:hypothetical protein
MPKINGSKFGYQFFAGPAPQFFTGICEVKFDSLVTDGFQITYLFLGEGPQSVSGHRWSLTKS